MPVRFTAIRAGLAALLLCLGAAVWADTPDPSAYRLGRGYPLGGSGIRLGGYASVGLQVPRALPWRFEISDLSLFVNWDLGGRFHFFSEVEIGDALSGGEDRSFDTREATLELERLYLDTLVTDALTIRLGKFLTPVGRWNLIHVDPLVWTATRPVATYGLFSTNATGVMLYGSQPVLDHRLDYSIYGDFTEALDPARTEPAFHNGAGGRIVYALADNLELGASYANYTLQGFGHQRWNLVGVDGFWTRDRFELSTEWVVRSSALRDLWQGYLQAVAPIAGDWYAIGRYEMFEQPQGTTGQLGVLGVAYRPIPPLVWKLEYRLGTQNRELAPDGLFASFAVLF